MNRAAVPHSAENCSDIVLPPDLPGSNIPITFLVRRRPFHETIELIIHIVYTLILEGIKYQTAQRIAGRIGGCISNG